MCTDALSKTYMQLYLGFPDIFHYGLMLTFFQNQWKLSHFVNLKSEAREMSASATGLQSSGVT